MDRLNLNQEWQSRKEQATARGVGVMTQVFAARAKNAEIWDVEGKRYIDFAGGIGVLNTGHCHPKVIRAVEAQLARFTHTCWQVMPYPGYVELAEKMNRLTPGAFAKKTIFFSTGAEAIENSIKIARTATGRSGVIAFSGAFHGRTIRANRPLVCDGARRRRARYHRDSEESRGRISAVRRHRSRRRHGRGCARRAWRHLRGQSRRDCGGVDGHRCHRERATRRARRSFGKCAAARA